MSPARPLFPKVQQQQQQPGNGSNTGCSFFFPLFNTSCPVQPRVPIIDLVLDNVVFENALLSLNTIRCANATEGAGIAGWQPCSGWGASLCLHYAAVPLIQ